MYRSLFLFVCVLLVVSCTKKDKLDVDISNLTADVIVERFDQDFYKSNGSNLNELKGTYPFLFPVQTPDSIWLAKMQDADEQELFGEVSNMYIDFTDEQEQLITLFKHVKYYFKDFKEPRTITILTNVDYQNSVTYRGNLLLISLDVFLGKDSKIYNDYPEYIKQNFTKDHIIVEVAKRIAETKLTRPKSRAFISRMVQYGKLQYLLDAFLPKVNETAKMGYTNEQLDWADYNDVSMWKYFVEKKLLFSNDQELNRRFLDNAPFSKFYSAQDNETPGRIGVWFGWQIVSSYMEHNDVTLQELLKTDNEEIFKKSKYKPSK